MWTIEYEELAGGQGLRFSVRLEDRLATIADAIRGWQEDAAFRSLFNDTLAKVPFVAFRWETPPVTSERMTQRFEFVALDSPGLARRPDPDAFAEHFHGSPDANVVAFSNLGRDAIMIVPRPIAGASAYGHLAAFVRGAPESQHQAFWQMVGNVMARRIGAKPVWLSTAGAGVAWLHVRLDDRPKYYGFAPYKSYVGEL